MGRFDIAIIGASLAGAATALSLGKSGIKVALIDSASFPRRKACGEGLSALGVAELGRLGLGEKLEKEAERRAADNSDRYIKRYRLISEKRSLCLPAGGIGIERHELDNLLLESAAEKGSVSLFLKQIVRSIDKTSFGGYSLTTSAGKISASQVVLACGTNEPLLNALGVRTARRARPRFGMSATWSLKSGSIGSEVIIALENNYEIFLTPVGAGRFNAALLSSYASGSLLNRKNCIALVKAKLRSIGIEAEPCTTFIGRTRLESSVRPGFSDGLFLVGDACEQFDPVGGMGMTHALLSSKVLSKELLNYFSGCLAISEAGVSYHNRRREVARPLRGFTRAVYSALIPGRKAFFALPTFSTLTSPLLTASISPQKSVGGQFGRWLVSMLGAPLFDKDLSLHA